jgi:SSS family solute:Na+ symporter
VIQIGFAAKDERTAARGYLYGALIILPVGFISAVIGMAAAVLYPGILPAEALPRVVLGLSPLAAGIILAGLWAADVSTASALLLGSATLVSSDIIKRFFAPNLSPARDQLICRITVLVLSVVTFLLALMVSGILKMLLIGLTLTTAYTLVVLMTMFWPAVCRRSSASWTLVATMVSLGLWLATPFFGRLAAGHPALEGLFGRWQEVVAFFPHPIYFTWLVSLAAFFLVTLLDKRRIVVS